MHAAIIIYKYLSKLLILVIIIVSYSSECRADYKIKFKWPEINNVELRLTVDATSERIYLNVPLFDKSNNKIYNFICRGGGANYLDKIGDELGLTFTPPLGCALYDKDENENSLLSEDDSPSWHSRAQIDYKYIVGICSNYPEYGSLRHFKLRGFILTLGFEDIVLDKDGNVAFFTLHLSVNTDKTVTSEKAETPNVLDPRLNKDGCKTVIEGLKKRMCRNPEKDFIWEECPK